MCDSDCDSDHHHGDNVEVVYPIGEETEVPQTNGQLFKTVLVEGSGPKPPHAAKVSVHYVGTLLSDGSKFDSSRDRGEPFEFTIGMSQVIKGWDKGVATMSKGEKAVLKCLPEYAYGKNGSPPKIPADSTLLFEVELLDWTKSEDISPAHDHSLMKAVQVEGADWERPDYESNVNMTVSLLAADGFDPNPEATVTMVSKEFNIVVGREVLPRGLETILKSMKKHEHCVVLVAAANSSSKEEALFHVPDTAFQYSVTLNSFTKVQPWKFHGAEKIAEGRKRKDEGNEYFKQNLWEKAREKYKRALEFVEHENESIGTELFAEARGLTVILFNNLAQVELNTGNLSDALTHCNKALGLDGSSVKALFKRGKSNAALGNWDEAVSDFKVILEKDAGNADAQRELAAVDAKIKAHHKKEKALYSKLFA